MKYEEFKSFLSEIKEAHIIDPYILVLHYHIIHKAFDMVADTVSFLGYTGQFQSTCNVFIQITVNISYRNSNSFYIIRARITVKAEKQS